jgi:hypothetical protein
MVLHRSAHALYGPDVFGNKVKIYPERHARANRTQVKTGFTCAIPVVFACAFGTLIVRVRLSTWILMSFVRAGREKTELAEDYAFGAKTIPEIGQIPLIT